MNARTMLARLTAAKRQSLQVAAAVAREDVVQLHADRALLLLRQAADRVPPLRMLEIYVRLQGLTGVHAEVVGNRVLASLGAVEGTAFVDAAAGPDTVSVFSTLRRRLRGRVHDDLRRAVELHTGVTQTALLDLHVRHAHGFVRALADEHAVSAACALYAELVLIPPSLTPVLQALVLNRVASAGAHDERLAVPSPAAGPAPTETSVALPALAHITASRQSLAGRNLSGRTGARRPA